MQEQRAITAPAVGCRDRVRASEGFKGAFFQHADGGHHTSSGSEGLLLAESRLSGGRMPSNKALQTDKGKLPVRFAWAKATPACLCR